MCCADFNFYINRQGIQGRKGEKGETGFSPTISVGTDTLNEYKLIIANENNSFETPNLRGNINVLDNGGTYLRYDAETQQISAQGLDAATSTNIGGVLMSTDADIQGMGDSTVVTPANVADALPVYLQGEGAVTITQDEVTSKTKINVDLSGVTSDVDSLKARTTAAENEIVGIQSDVASLDTNVSNNTNTINSHTASINNINNSINSLQTNKQDKLTAGEGITIDSNNVISSTGGGGAGDITAAGDNTFTGTNTFERNPIVSGLTLKNGDLSTQIYVNSEGNLNLGNSIQFGNISISGSGSNPTIQNGFDNSYYLTQNSIEAGSNINITKTAQGISISSTGGGGSTPENMVTTDTDQYINSYKTFNYDKSVTDAASNAVELGNNGIRFKTFTSGYEHRIEGYDYTNGSLHFGGFGGGIKFSNSIYDKNGNEVVGGGLTAAQAADAAMGSNNVLRLAIPEPNAEQTASSTGIITIRLNCTRLQLVNKTTQEEFWINAGTSSAALISAPIRVKKGDIFVYTATGRVAAGTEFCKFTYSNGTNSNA